MRSRRLFLFNHTWKLSFSSPLGVSMKVFTEGGQSYKDKCWAVYHSAQNWLLSPDLGQAFSLLSILPMSE